MLSCLFCGLNESGPLSVSSWMFYSYTTWYKKLYKGKSNIRTKGGSYLQPSSNNNITITEKSNIKSSYDISLQILWS